MTANSTADGAFRWKLPNHQQMATRGTQLKILNSFTKKKEVFLPSDSTTIKWYSCGPTVYDVAHLGHARCYITFDIIRRILRDYFGYNVFYVMNITDIDDKIIKRARSNHLADEFIRKSLGRDDLASHLANLTTQIKIFIQNYRARRSNETTDPYKLEMINNIIESSNKALQNLESFNTSQERVGNEQDLLNILERLREVIADEQDEKLAHTIDDHEIFKALTIKFEQEYHEDMQRLNVLPPSALTRVSDYIAETGMFIKKLESNGFAYRSGGSVYFDTEKFDADPKHTYAKLVREAFGQKGSLDEGEGQLSSSVADVKKSPNDFALWKKSKPGEPSWNTQDYESGRPGWHIECSVMASELLGENFDIHSGGCDLKFPHHDNEIAQAEAYFNTGKDWVNYFIHSGHLSISGCKMSKSLKNFITIRQALQDYTSRQLRFAFLAHNWADTLDYSPNTMNTAISYEKTFREFFLNTADSLRRWANSSSNRPTGGKLYNHFSKWSSDDQLLNSDFITAVNKVDSTLCDNLDTRSTLNVLAGLVKECNKRPNANSILIYDISKFIGKILSIFGTCFDELRVLDKIFSPEMNQISSGVDSSESTSSNSDVIFKYVDTLAQFRADIRKISKGGDAQLSVNQILSLCDVLRDQTLPLLGVRLEDKEVGGAPYVVKLVDPETLAKEKALAEKKEQEKKLKEETAKLHRLKLMQEREDKMKIPPTEMFRSQTDKYSKFDDKGMPSHDASGKEMSKSLLKKLQKLYSDQEVKYNKYITSGEQ